jgi:hypothetical protein
VKFNHQVNLNKYQNERSSLHRHFSRRAGRELPSSYKSKTSMKVLLTASLFQLFQLICQKSVQIILVINSELTTLIRNSSLNKQSQQVF